MVLLELKIVLEQDVYTHGKPGHRYLIVPTGNIEPSLTVTNISSNPMKLVFSTGQRYDFIIKDIHGKEKVRWSEGEVFPDVMGELTINPEQTVTYGENLLLGKVQKPLGLGKYVVEGTITAHSIELGNNHSISVPLVANASFEIIGYDHPMGYIYRKLHKIGTKSEGPDYILQSTDGVDYQLLTKDQSSWFPDKYLEKFSNIWDKSFFFIVEGEVELSRPPRIKVDAISRIPRK